MTYDREIVKKEAIEIYERLRMKYEDHEDVKSIMFDSISSALLILIMNSSHPKRSDQILAHINDIFKKGFEGNKKSGAWSTQSNAALSKED